MHLARRLPACRPLGPRGSWCSWTPTARLDNCAASAKPFRTLLKLQNNTDPDVDLWVQDADLQGNHLHVFAHQFFNNAMLDGMCHILVDHPDTYNLPNLAAQKASGARPFMKIKR